MIMNDKKLLEFKKLLVQLMPTNEYITNFEVGKAYGYLFQQELMPFPLSSTLYENMMYLKEVMEGCGLKTLDDVLEHYENLRKKMRAFIQKEIQSYWN